MLALLAFSCVAGVASANSGIQYNDAPPTVTGEKAPSGQQPPAGKSNTGNKGGGGTNASGGGSGTSGKGSGGSTGNQGGVAGQKGAANGDAGGQPDRQRTAAEGDEEAEALAVAPVSSGSDGGSSPLVPILIAIAVLAAISVGAVLIRRHRQGESTGSDVSPEAS